MTANADLSKLGATVTEDGVHFLVWVPFAERVLLHCEQQFLEMKREADGYHSLFVPGCTAGARYRYSFDLDGDERGPWPDPMSRFQPEGVHGHSEVIDPGSYTWGDGDWQGVAAADLVFYELHVGTFSAEGTFAAARERLPYLKDLGITAIELLPVADFPGRWNWGYDPAAFFAPSRAYGRPDDLRAFIDEAHQMGMAVYIDVVYNHLGPDGAYLAAFAPMFSKEHETPWGQAINLDGDHSHGVRRLFLDNAIYWLDEFHADGLRLDATFALIDSGPKHFLAEMSERVAALPGPRRYLFAEDPHDQIINMEPRDRGGFGLDGVWADDFHHQVRRIAAGDSHGYFAPFPTTTAGLAHTINRGWFFDKPPKGSDPSGVSKDAFVVCIQNHDQVGNRPHGDRLHHVIDAGLYRALSSMLLFIPETPLLFMGQEWAASTPFCFFTDHYEELGQKVSEGRRREFQAFPGFSGALAEPQDPNTFAASKLNWAEIDEDAHQRILTLYRDALRRRKQLRGDVDASSPTEGVLLLRRQGALMVVTTSPGMEVTLEESVGQISWHSEEASYADNPMPPRLIERDGARVLSCDGACAVLFTKVESV